MARSDSAPLDAEAVERHRHDYAERIHDAIGEGNIMSPEELALYSVLLSTATTVASLAHGFTGDGPTWGLLWDAADRAIRDELDRARESAAHN